MDKMTPTEKAAAIDRIKTARGDKQPVTSLVDTIPNMPGDVHDKAMQIIEWFNSNSAPKGALDRAIASTVVGLEIKEEAQKIYDARRNATLYQGLQVRNLTESLATAEPFLNWRIEGLMQRGHNVTLTALYKSGKTTMVNNLIRSCVDGVPFLEEFNTYPVDGNVVVFNHELDEAQYINWLGRVSIQNTDKVIPVNLRGMGLYLQDEAAQDWAIEQLKAAEAEVWIIDPLQSALRGTVNDDAVASDWIAAAERVKAAAGVSELVLVTHTSHKSKHFADADDEARSAGSARWSGWPDVLWSYTFDDEGQRYLSANGRDVSVEQRAIDYEESTHNLTSRGKGSSRKQVKVKREQDSIQAAWNGKESEHLTKAEIAAAIGTSVQARGFRDAFALAVSSGRISECGCDPEKHRKSPNGQAPTAFKLWNVVH